jgi:hypothetical protein
MSEHQSPRFNDLLAALPSDELASLRAHATVVELAANSTLTRAIVITSGTALRLPFEAFVQMMDRSKAFRDLIHQNNNRIAERGQQIAACNLSHQLQSRLCRWLLQVIDNSDDPNIVITQDNLAQMLGVNRARLNEALKGLHALDAIAPTQRGVLTIIDASLILERACDCYPVARFSKPG